MKLAAAVLAAALLATGCSATETVQIGADAPPEDSVGKVLRGFWSVSAPDANEGTTLELTGAEYSVGGCTYDTGNWAARGGLFLASTEDEFGDGGFVISEGDDGCAEDQPDSELRWLKNAAGYRTAGGGWQLLNRAGATLATLAPRELPDTAEDTGEETLTRVGDGRPTPQERARLNETPAAPLPAGMRPAGADELVGRWRSAKEITRCSGSTLEFHADGSWGLVHDQDRGRWVLGTGGLALASGFQDLIACGSDSYAGPTVHDWMERLARVGFDGAALVLLDVDARELGRFQSAPPTPTPTPTPEDPRRKGQPVPGGTRYLAHAGEHQFDLSASEGEYDGPFDVLFGVGKDDTTGKILTGCATGSMWLTVLPRTTPPAPLAKAMKGWEIGEEDTMTIREALVAYDGLGDWGEEVFAPSRPGLHRVRVLAKGRATNYDGVCFEPTESYEVTIWPVDAREPRLARGRDGA